MAAHLIVRAEVRDPDARDPFDRWYEEEHLPQAVRDFGAEHAKRGWSDVEPNVHYAFYRFSDLAAARAVGESDAIKALLAEFDWLWDGRVVRTRDIVEIIQDVDP